MQLLMARHKPESLAVLTAVPKAKHRLLVTHTLKAARRPVVVRMLPVVNTPAAKHTHMAEHRLKVERKQLLTAMHKPTLMP